MLAIHLAVVFVLYSRLYLYYASLYVYDLDDYNITFGWAFDCEIKVSLRSRSENSITVPLILTETNINRDHVANSQRTSQFTGTRDEA